MCSVLTGRLDCRGPLWMLVNSTLEGNAAEVQVMLTALRDSARKMELQQCKLEPPSNITTGEDGSRQPRYQLNKRYV